MPDLVNVTYAQTGKSLAVNRLGMREMQERVYEKRKAQEIVWAVIAKDLKPLRKSIVEIAAVEGWEI